MALLPLNAKPLNAHAKSWFPEAKKPSENCTQPQELPLSFPYYDAIYGVVPKAAVYEQAPPFQFHQPVTVTVPAVMFEAAPNQNVPFGYRGYTFPELLFHEHQRSDGFLLGKNNNKDHKLFEESNSLQEISSIPRKPKFLRNKFMPPRLGRRCFIDDFREKKSPAKKVWKPKKDEISTDHSPSEEESPVCNKTTVMLKNVPNQYRRDSLMEFLDRKCCELHIAYDFLYLPMDFTKGDNLGFAFVNFTTASAAIKIKAALQDYKWGEFCIPNGRFTSKKILEITWAKIQGKEALVKHFKNSRFTCDNQEYLPVMIFPARKGIITASSTVTSSLTTVGHLQGFRNNVRENFKISRY